MLLCTKMRLQVSEADAEALEFMQGKCRGLYNWWVMRLRDGERWPGWAEAKATGAATANYRKVAVSRADGGTPYASFVTEQLDDSERTGGLLAIALGIKTWETGVTEQGRIYTVGAFKGPQWYNRQLDTIRSQRDRCQKKSRRYLHLSEVYHRVSERQRNKQRDCLHKAAHLIAYRLVESTVVMGDRSQRRMVTS